jgi:hypothetical protein
LTHNIAISLGSYSLFIYEYRYCVFVLVKKHIKRTEVLRLSCCVLKRNGIKNVRLNFYAVMLDLNFTVVANYTYNRTGITTLRKYQLQSMITSSMAETCSCNYIVMC